MHSKTRRLGGVVAAAVIVMVAASMAITPVHAAKQNQIKSFMLNSGMAPEVRGSILVVENKAQTFFIIKVQHAAPNTTYDVMVDGAVVDQITTNGDGNGRVIHRQKNKGTPTPLPYDPRGALVEVAATGTADILLSSTVPATPEEAAQVIVINNFDLTNTGTLGTASATANFKEKNGRMRLQISVKGLNPNTDYDLVVGGTVIGTFTTDGQGNANITLDSRPQPDDGSDGAGQLDDLLTFDPRGALIEIHGAGTADVFLTGTFPTAPIPGT